MRQIILFLFLLFSFYHVQAQNEQTISGEIKDTFNFSTTIYSSISLIRASDSILQTYTRSDENGNFSLKVPKSDQYILLIAHPNFVQFSDLIEVKDQDIHLGLIPMLSKRQFLTEVTITDQQKIVIKGDTIEFNADSFQTRQYDNVDELLKKLPGIEISRDGTIKAYGEKVEKMLVDGEEFFSDDPAVVAKTLRASSVDKVQVYDKKSDQAEFTGIDDGEKIKTINLKLKDHAKQGYFGKVSAGGGLPSYWENQAMFNTFNKKRKFSLYGTMSNTNTTGLNWQDQGKFGGGGGISFGGGGGMFRTFSGDGGSFQGQGIPKTWSAGTYYSNKWLDDKVKANGGYQFNQKNIDAINNSRTQYILPDTQYISQNNGEKNSKSLSHSVNANFDFDIDSTSSIKLRVGGKYGIEQDQTETSAFSSTLDGILINENKQSQNSESDNQSMNANLLYRKKMKKEGRTFSANFNGTWSGNKQKGFLNSDYQLYAIDSIYALNQRKENNTENSSIQTKLTYTEPLSKIAFLEVNYSLNSNNNQSVNHSFDRDPNTENDVLNPFYSSSYVYNSLMNQGGANLRFNWEKINLSVGGNISNTDFKQSDRMRDTSYQYSALNFFPQINFQYKKSRQSNFRLGYSGATKQPTIEQLQPFRNNTDPLNIAIGNPNLKQEFSHNLNLNFYNFKVLSGQHTMIGMNFSVIQNAISTMQNIDISGRRTYQSVNVDGNMNAFLYGYFGFGKILGITPSFGINGNLMRTNDFINGEKNINTIFNASPNLNLRYDQDTTFNFSYGFSPSYNKNSSSIRPDVKTDYWTFNQSFDGSVLLPFRFKLGTVIDWNIRQKIDPLEKNNNVFFWNAYLSKSFLKDKSLEARIYAHDLLNQNIGYNRYDSPNQISENNYNTIRRYFLFSLTWNFTKTGAKPPSSGGIQINMD